MTQDESMDPDGEIDWTKDDGVWQAWIKNLRRHELHRFMVGYDEMPERGGTSTCLYCIVLLRNERRPELWEHRLEDCEAYKAVRVQHEAWLNKPWPGLCSGKTHRCMMPFDKTRELHLVGETYMDQECVIRTEFIRPMLCALAFGTTNFAAYWRQMVGIRVEAAKTKGAVADWAVRLSNHGIPMIHCWLAFFKDTQAL